MVGPILLHWTLRGWTTWLRTRSRSGTDVGADQDKSENGRGYHDLRREFRHRNDVVFIPSSAVESPSALRNPRLRRRAVPQGLHHLVRTIETHFCGNRVGLISVLLSKLLLCGFWSEIGWWSPGIRRRDGIRRECWTPAECRRRIPPRWWLWWRRLLCSKELEDRLLPSLWFWLAL